MSRPDRTVSNANLLRVASMLLAEVDPVASRDLVKDVADLPVAAMFVKAYCPLHDLRVEESAFVAPWTDLAVLAGQIDYFAASQLDAGQLETFAVVHDATFQAARKHAAHKGAE